MNRWLYSINTLLAVGIIAFSALLASRFLSSKITGMFPPKAAKTLPQQITADSGSDLNSYGAILSKGLFGKATISSLTPITAKATEKAQAAPAVNIADYVLLGTVQGAFNESFALVQKTSSKEERVFRMGDNVFNAGPLVAVRKEYIEVMTGKTRAKIMTPVASAAAATAAPAQQPPPQQGGLAAQTGAGNYVIDQRALNGALDNIGQAMTDARLLPSMKDGKVEGFRISEVKPQGIFGTIGMKNGDVLLRMNDFPIDSPEKAIQSLASLKGQSRIRLDLVRDGQPTTFNYDIR